MALAATITVDPRRGLTSISPLIYGQFLEHFHQQVFGGAFEPGSPLADGRGFRLCPNPSDSDEGLRPWGSTAQQAHATGLLPAIFSTIFCQPSWS